MNLQCPLDRLVGPRRDAVRQVEENVADDAAPHDPVTERHLARVGRLHSCQALEERGLARAVRADQAEDSPDENRKLTFCERLGPAKSLREVANLQQWLSHRHAIRPCAGNPTVRAPAAAPSATLRMQGLWDVAVRGFIHRGWLSLSRLPLTLLAEPEVHAKEPLSRGSWLIGVAVQVPFR